jgi:DNA polymerase-4
MGQRKIIHIDMDCFYAAVEEKHNPALKGKPVGIGGPPQSRSVLCTANYEARKYGVRAAMPSSQALRKCPQLILVPPNFKLYTEYSRQIRKIFLQYTDLVEPLSLDEAFLDVSQGEKCQGSATLMAQEIRQKIFKETELTASAGAAPNKFLAKVASDWNKPNGQFVIPPEKVAEFVRTLPVTKIFGVGAVTAEKMHKLGLHTCADLQKWELWKLKQHFGTWCITLQKNAHGNCDREVVADSERKSVSVEETFSQDRQSLDELIQELKPIYEDWLGRIQRGGYQEQIRNIQVKVKYSDFQQVTRECAFPGVAPLIEFEKLLEQIWMKSARPIRLLGVGAKISSEKDSQLTFSVA